MIIEANAVATSQSGSKDKQLEWLDLEFLLIIECSFIVFNVSQAMVCCGICAAAVLVD